MATIAEKRRNLQALLTELKAGQDKMEKGEQLSQADGDALEAKAKEAEQLQAELEQHTKRQRLIERGASLPQDPALPSGQVSEDEEKDALGGYLTLGQRFVMSEAFKRAQAAGFPQGYVGEAAEIKTAGFLSRFSPMTKGEIAHLRETKALPTIGAGVTEPMRLSDGVRATELDPQSLLAILNTAPMSSPIASWVRYTYTRAAAVTAAGNQKPEATMSTENITETAKNIAVTMPVTEQQLRDNQQVINEIDTTMRWDVLKNLEEECAYGSGSGEHFTGFFNDSDIAALTRTKSGDTLIDKVKRMATNVEVAGFNPNGLAIHPYDWEEVVLSKGSDNRYVWVVVTDGDTMRMWGLRVTKTLSARETALASEPERNILVGDFQRGATLFLRDALSLQIGWNADDFVKNKRTIRAEARGVLAIRRPAAFAKYKTHAASGAS